MSNDRSLSEFLNSVIKSMRIWQWPKNLIVFTIPLGVASLDFEIYAKSFYSFLGISLLASSVYFFNDVNDIELDKSHNTKKYRPIPSGKIKLNEAYSICLILSLLGCLILNTLSIQTLFVGILYLATNIGYTYKFKYIKFLDVLSVSFLFVMRILIGSSAVDTPASLYLLAFIFFASISLALSKRISILNNSLIENTAEYKSILKDLYNSQKLINLLIISSLLSVVTFLLWIAGLKNIDIFSLETLLFAGTGLLMVSILNKIIKLSSEGLLEDFVLGVMKNKELLLRIVVALLLLILGLYV